MKALMKVMPKPAHRESGRIGGARGTVGSSRVVKTVRELEATRVTPHDDSPGQRNRWTLAPVSTVLPLENQPSPTTAHQRRVLRYW
jgi:hypothetical protein